MQTETVVKLKNSKKNVFCPIIIDQSGRVQELLVEQTFCSRRVPKGQKMVGHFWTEGHEQYVELMRP